MFVLLGIHGHATPYWGYVGICGAVHVARSGGAVAREARTSGDWSAGTRHRQLNSLWNAGVRCGREEDPH